MSAVLQEIEERLPELSFKEQLLLLERLARALREGRQPSGFASGNQLAAMAADPDIQREIREIESEFSVALQDGLDKS
jgi:hypothetical protein